MKYVLAGLFSILIQFYANAQPGQGNVTNKNTLLNQSFWQNHPGVDVVKAEVAKGNDPSELNSMSMDPVVLAINAGAPNESIIYLLEQTGNTAAKLTHDGRTYIFWAAMRGNTEIMDYLLKNGAKTDVHDSHGLSPLNFAASAGQQNRQVYDLLLNHGINLKTDLNDDGANALLLAIGSDTSFQLTEYFQSKGLNIKSKDAKGATAFDYAARTGNFKAMKMLLDKGVGYTNNAMLMAAQGGRGGGNTLEVFQYLEKTGIKPTVISSNGENALHAVVRRPNQKEVVQYFLDKGVDVNQANNDGITVFMNAAAFNQDTSTIALLLPTVKNINQKNKAGASALALAARSNTAQVVEYLLENGADIHVTDAKGNNLAYYLLESYNQRLAKEFQPKLRALQVKGFNAAVPQGDGSTLYHLAVAKNDLSLLKLVHDNYPAIDINVKNTEGLTALHKAAMVSKDHNMLEYLVSIGAKKDIKTSFDETAYDLASENELLANNHIAIEFLK